MTNFDRQYRFAAGQAGGKAFEIGAPGGEVPMPLRVQFSFEKTDLETPNTGKISIWNLSPAHIAELEKTNCIASLNAGYLYHNQRSVYVHQLHESMFLCRWPSQRNGHRVPAILC